MFVKSKMLMFVFYPVPKLTRIKGVWVIVEYRVSRLGSVEVRRSRLKSRGRGFEVEVEVLKSRSRF